MWGKDPPDLRGYLHRAWFCESCLCFTSLRCNGMVKANLKPTTVHCKDRLQGRKRGSESVTSHPCLRNCPTGVSGARNEKSSWDKGIAARSQAHPPSLSPCSAGDGPEHLPLHKGCGGWCKPGLCPSPWGASPQIGAFQRSPKPWAPQQQLQAVPPLI